MNYVSILLVQFLLLEVIDRNENFLILFTLPHSLHGTVYVHLQVFSYRCMYVCVFAVPEHGEWA